MDFWSDDEKHGIAFGDPIDGRLTLIKTDDGGDTWHDIPFEERPEVVTCSLDVSLRLFCISIT